MDNDFIITKKVSRETEYDYVTLCKECGVLFNISDGPPTIKEKFDHLHDHVIDALIKVGDDIVGHYLDASGYKIKIEGQVVKKAVHDNSLSILIERKDESRRWIPICWVNSIKGYQVGRDV
jgi:hypothetical protein